MCNGMAAAIEREPWWARLTELMEPPFSFTDAQLPQNSSLVRNEGSGAAFLRVGSLGSPPPYDSTLFNGKTEMSNQPNS